MKFNKSELYKSLLEITQELLVALDRTGAVVYINPRGCEILEEKEENILGNNWFDKFFDKNLNDEVKSVYLELVKGNIEFSQYFENTIMTSQGKNKMMAWNNKAIYDEGGKISYVLSSGRDITKEKNDESRLSQSTLALELMMDRTNK